MLGEETVTGAGSGASIGSANDKGESGTRGEGEREGGSAGS